MTDTYAAQLPVRGQPVLVVGGGMQAAAQVAVLLDAEAVVTVVAPTMVASLADLGQRGLVQCLERAWEPGDLDGCRLVLVTDPVVEHAVADTAAARGIWCVAVPGDVAGSSTPGDGEVVLVGGGPGDPDLITVGGMRALRQADVVVCDRLAPLGPLSELRPGVQVIDVAKIPGGRSTSQDEINRLLVEHARDGRRVVRLKGGDSFVFGRGGEEVQACVAAGVPVRVIPGVTSAIAAPELAGIPVTHRGLVQGFTVVSGHVPPDDPRCTVSYDALADSGTTLVLLMAVANLEAIVRRLLAAGMHAETPAAVVADGGLPSQRVLRAPLSQLGTRARQASVSPPAVVLIGSVAGLEPFGVGTEVTQPSAVADGDLYRV